MKSILEATHENRQIVSHCTNHMFQLAQAARMLGQDTLADELNSIADDLIKSAEAVSDAMGKDLTDYVQKAEGATNNMLAASLLNCIGADKEAVKDAFNRLTA